MHKFAFCWGSAADAVGGALSPRRWPPNCIYWACYQREGRRKGERKKVKGKEGIRGGMRDLAHPKISAWRPLWYSPQLVSNVWNVNWNATINERNDAIKWQLNKLSTAVPTAIIGEEACAATWRMPLKACSERMPLIECERWIQQRFYEKIGLSYLFFSLFYCCLNILLPFMVK